MKQVLLYVAAAALLAAGLGGCAQRTEEAKAEEVAMETAQEQNIPTPEQDAPMPEGEPAVLNFDSFDGGGPEYTAEIADPDVLACEYDIFYPKADHDRMPGSGYTVTFTFRGLKSGETDVTVSARSPIAENYDAIYRAAVDEGLNVTLRKVAVIDPEQLHPSTAMLAIRLEERTFYGSVADNPAAQMLFEQLRHSVLDLSFTDSGGFAKEAELPWIFPESEEEIAVGLGDVVLSHGDRLLVCYGEGVGRFTPVTSLNAAREDILDAFGDGEAEACIELEWSE